MSLASVVSLVGTVDHKDSNSVLRTHWLGSGYLFFRERTKISLADETLTKASSTGLARQGGVVLPPS